MEERYRDDREIYSEYIDTMTYRLTEKERLIDNKERRKNPLIYSGW